jgi:DNA-binding CsgD family transcriptional regulator
VTLSTRDFDRVLYILPELYAYARRPQFFETSIKLLPQLLECDHAAFFVYEHTDKTRLTTAVETDKRITPIVAVSLAEGASSHPLARHYRAVHSTSAALLTDTPMRTRSEHRERYADVYQLLQMNYELALPLTLNSAGAVGVSFRREHRNFSERDQNILNLLQPHLRRAHHNATHLERHEIRGDEQRCEADRLGLTERELQVAFWLAEGKTNREIGLILGSSIRAIEKHVEHLLAKLGCENRTSAAIALHGLLQSCTAHEARSDRRVARRV